MATPPIATPAPMPAAAPVLSDDDFATWPAFAFVVDITAEVKLVAHVDNVTAEVELVADVDDVDVLDGMAVNASMVCSRSASGDRA